MSAHISPSPRPFFPEEPIDIPEDSTILRTICCIPSFGMIPSIFIAASLKQQWELTKKEPRMIELLHIKNQYKVADVIRNVLTIALFVAAIAYKVITFIPFLIGITSLVAWSTLEIHRRNENIELIEAIKTTGYKANMRAR